MRKKLVSLAVIAVLLLGLLSGCCLRHAWTPASCVTPQTCAKCGKTEGEALGHTWVDADCVTPKTCAVCAKTEGEALGHQVNWAASTEDFTKMAGTCTACKEELVEDVDWMAAAPSFVLGNWEGALVQVEGQFYDLDEGITFEIREDGTATLDMIDEQFELTWSMTQAECYSEDFQIEVLAYTFVDEDGGQYTVAVTYSFGAEVTGIYLYVGDKVMVFRK